jgi:methionyl-tRNA formyltransferase
MAAKPLRIVVLAPIANGLYSRLVTYLTATTPGMVVTDVIVRTPWTWKRIQSELRRDGLRLLRKAYRKLVLRERVYPSNDAQTIRALKEKLGLPGRTLYDLEKLCNLRVTSVEDHNDDVSLQIIERAEPDVIAFTGGGLLRVPLLRLPRIGVLNCHMGMLPTYRGMDVVEWPFLDFTAVSPQVGLTLHLVDEGVDTGPILLQRAFEPGAATTFVNIRRRLEPMMVELMLEGLCGLRDNTLSPIPQVKSAGKQFFVMHPRIEALAAKRLGASRVCH